MHSNEAKLKFLAHVVKHGLQHFDDGGAVLSGPGGGTQMNAVSPNQGFIGSIGNALGQNDQFQAGTANIQDGTNTAQLNNAYSGVQGGLQQQQNLVNSLAGQGAQGIQSQSQLGQQLQQQAMGKGPNPAQAALNQETARNIANQSAMAAGQRGAASNAGLIARQAAQQGAGIQQAAVGQGATLQAQQQIAAQQQLQNLAGTQIGQQAGAIQGINQQQQNEQNILQGANTANNNANVAMQGNINNINSQTALANQQANAKTLHGVSGLVSNVPVVGSLLGGMAEGGMVHKMAEGGSVGPQSFVGQWVNSDANPGSAPSIAAPAAAPAQYTPPAKDKDSKSSSPLSSLPTTSMPSLGGSGSTGAGGLAGSEIPAGAEALAIAFKGGLMKKGGPVKAGKGQKAEISDDSIKNDKVPTMLSEGEIVLPRHVTMHPNAPQKAAEFVAAALAKRGKK